MARSSSSRGLSLIVHLDRVALASLTAGLALYVMPLWAEGRLRVAFWVTLISTLLHIYTSHGRAQQSDSSSEAGGDV